ncbi:DUF2835 domain-containing protein [Celerinatantimonas sp. YJH-8]|uniref:DUF2835 domain-containing protein n=1 Tax=Celerinatantimonas sp. YJH-8 TaxID=3228714 RepID=UPI0038C399AE
MQQFLFSLSVSYEDYLRVYQGTAKNIIVTCDNGLTLQLPAERFRPFVSQLGVIGRFRLTTDNNHKFKSLEKII